MTNHPFRDMVAEIEARNARASPPRKAPRADSARAAVPKVVFVLQMPMTLRDGAREAADVAGLSLSEWLRRVIRAEITGGNPLPVRSEE